MFVKYFSSIFLLGTTLTFSLGINGKSLESSTVGILVPVQEHNASGNFSGAFDDEDDAVIIDASAPSGPPVDSTPSAFDPSVDCFLPAVKGPCRAVIDQWYFDKNSGECVPFQWSGCGGNNNRFAEKEFCQNHCGNAKSQQLKVGNDTSNSSNSNSSCGDFVGCGPLKCGVSPDPITGCLKCDCQLNVNETENGNETKIIVGSVSGSHPEESSLDDETLKQKLVNLGNPKEVCALPETRGNCRAMTTRWRYNPEIKSCVIFHFGGCLANPNNFVSEEKCQEFCRGQ